MKNLLQTLSLVAVLSAVCPPPFKAAAGLIPEETSLSLNGTWRLQPTGAEERQAAVPGFWERLPGLANIHQATYRREFEVPGSFAGRRVLLRFDAVGDAAEISVNGQHGGGHCST